MHGGKTFNDYESYLEFLENYELNFEKEKSKLKGWKYSLEKKVGNSFEVVILRMPSPRNAKYSEWKIWFEKYFPYFLNGIILIGHSLGGIFLAKYLSENRLPKKINSIHLVAAPFDEEDVNECLGDFKLPESLEKIDEQVNKIFLYHSKDDKVAPFIELEKYAKVLPKAEKIIFEDRNHFEQEEFPEIVEKIKKVSKIKSNER